MKRIMILILSVLIIAICANKCNAQTKEVKNDTTAFGGEIEKYWLILDEQLANLNNPKWIDERKRELAEKKMLIISTYLEAKGVYLSKNEIIGYQPGKLITRPKPKP